MALNGLVIPNLDHLGPSGSGGPGSLPTFDLSRSDFDKPEVDERNPMTEKVELLPPELDISEDQENKLAMYLDSELALCQSERSEYIRKIARLKEKIRTKFPEFPKDWPIANASQITVPVIKEAVDTLTSRVFQTIMAAEPQASIRTKNAEYKDFAVDYEEFLGLYSSEKLDMENFLDTITTETINLGTAIAEVTTKKDKRAVYRYDGLTKRYVKAVKTLYDGPIVYHVPLEHFWIRPGYQDVQTAPWAGKEIQLTWSQLKDMAFAGEINPEKLKKLWHKAEPGSTERPVKEAEEKLEDVEPMDYEEFRVFELSVRWDADGDSLDEELLVYYHWESRTILRRKYNTFRNGRRPWIVYRYKRIPHRFYGEGIAEMLEQLQDEISTIHNQRLDNATIANLQIILVKRLIKGLSPGDRLWTGKIVKVQDVNEDVGTLRLGEIYPSTVNNEHVTRSYIRGLSGIGETATGQAQPVSRTTATAQMALMEELNRRFDKVVKGIRKSNREVFIHTTDLFAEFGTNGLATEYLGERGDKMEQILGQPQTFAPGNARVVILATKSTVNREVEFQSAIAVMNLITQIGTQLLQVSDRFAPQMSPVVAHELIQAIKGPFRKVIQYSDAGNVEEALSVLSVLERVLPAPEDLGGMATAQNAENADLARGAGGLAAGSNSGNGGAPTEDAEFDRMVAALRSARPSNGRRPGVA